MDNYWRLWPDIFDRNTGFTMDDLRNSKIPAPKSPKIKMLSGKEMDIDEEFGKNQYTVLFNMNPRSGDAVECLKQQGFNPRWGLSDGVWSPLALFTTVALLCFSLAAAPSGHALFSHFQAER